MNSLSYQITPNDLKIIELALHEDLGSEVLDITTAMIFDAEQHSKNFHAKIISKHGTPIIVSGTALIAPLFQKLDAPLQCNLKVNDGETLNPGDTLVQLTSTPQGLLMIERTLLNFLRHLSAIATRTHAFTQKVAHTQLKILDTRKTTPGLRALEKYAIRCGGGHNHRMGLYDAILIKDTHIDLLGDITYVLEKLPTIHDHHYPVIIEVRSLEELDKTLKYGTDKIHRVLLDNMSCADMSVAVKRCKGIFETEASGNINLDNITAIAETGVNYASIGSLTYQAGQVDLSMYTHE